MVMKIAIATNSSYKLHAILKALYELDFEFEYTNDKADSGVSEQPMQQGETKQGSINRAKNILYKFPESDLGLGVEFGYEPIDGKYHMVCWASIITKEGKIFSEQSSTLELPKILVDSLLSDISVDTKLEDLFLKLKDIHTNRIYKDYIKKRRVIYECTTNVALRYILDSELY